MSENTTECQAYNRVEFMESNAHREKQEELEFIGLDIVLDRQGQETTTKNCIKKSQTNCTVGRVFILTANRVQSLS